MVKKTLYFGNPAYLSLANKQLVIRKPNQDDSFVRTIPIEDIAVIVVDDRQITMTSGLIAALLDNACSLITCDSRSLPNGLLLPLSENTQQNERFQSQIDASLPLKKQLWQQTIKVKIANQASVLEKWTDAETKNMRIWVKKVKSGDVDNLEARAAAYYWKNIFPCIPGFIRDREGDPPNHYLNFGYSILRGVMARALVVSGLLPTLGIHHHNKYNAYCLADDIMEPYRPYVDVMVIKMLEAKREEDSAELTKEDKATLLTIPTIEVNINSERSPLMVAVAQTTASLFKCFNGEIRKITYPEMQ